MLGKATAGRSDGGAAGDAEFWLEQTRQIKSLGHVGSPEGGLVVRGDRGLASGHKLGNNTLFGPKHGF